MENSKAKIKNYIPLDVVSISSWGALRQRTRIFFSDVDDDTSGPNGLDEENASDEGNAVISYREFSPDSEYQEFFFNMMNTFITEDIPDTKPTIQPIKVTILQGPGYGELKDALHKIRSRILKRKLPVVFFDGFGIDSDKGKLSWLKYFLSPMQNGIFFDERCDQNWACCLCFFYQTRSNHFTGFPQKQPDGSTFFREAKGPDFVSRLRRCVNKNSPNYQSLENVIKWYLRTETHKPLSIGMFKSRVDSPLKRTFKGILAAHANVLGPNRVKEILDVLFVIRRAILLRSLFIRMLEEDKELHIDGNVLNALLSIPGFRHGARSIESIMNMSQILSMKDANVGFMKDHLLPEAGRAAPVARGC